MDRRTLLAMVLLFALFMVWSKLYMKWYGPDEEALADAAAVEETLGTPAEQPAADRPIVSDDVADSTPAAVPSTMPAADDLLVKGGELPFEPLAFSGAASSPVMVTTDLYRMTIDPNGGQVTSWQGLEFSGVDLEGDVELVPERGELDPAPRGDVLMFERGELDLTDAAFSVEGPSALDLSGTSGARELVLVATTDGGMTVRKIFTFRPGAYDFDVNYEVATVDATARTVMSRTLGEPVSARFAWS
jgi:YidC/Oxa1 family membrane protein insertase